MTKPSPQTASPAANTHGWVDIGVNLGDKRFAGDLDETVARAVAAGVDWMVVTGTSVAGSERAADIAAERSTHLRSTAGVHPHGAKSCDTQTLGALRALASRPEVAAIGECGLDFNRDFSPRPVQETWFRAQLELATELDMPLFVHERDAFQRFIEIVDDYSALPPLVVHCFTGSPEALDAYVARGFYIGITGWICDERRGLHLRELVSRVPSDRLMVETDAPYLTPRDYRPKPKGGRNEPALLPHIGATVASCLGLSPHVLAQSTTANARRFFGLPAADSAADASAPT